MFSSVSLSLAILAVLGLAENAIGQIITEDSHFYGQSPPVYPSPQGTGIGDWAQAYVKAAALVAQMTLDEKSNLTYGVRSTTGCSGTIPGIPRLGFPGLCLQDAGNGVRATDFVSAFPSGLHIGASWNKGLAYNAGHALGAEYFAKGVNVALGPVVGPIGRIAEGGRNWEGYTNDPYMSGALAGMTIKGIQANGVMTSVKHFIGNEQETNRNPVNSPTAPLVQSSSSNIDDKTLHELYLWPFANAIRAGSANIMCSYNRLNNSYSCGNSKLLNGILKTELGFQGFVVSDWFAQHGGYSTAEAGLDMVMPTAGVFWGGNLTAAIRNGTMPESRLTDMVTRIIASWYKLGQDSSHPAPGIGMPIDLLAPHPIVDARDPAARSVLFQGAVEGHVLVKNNGALPLKAPKSLALFGYDAKAPDINSPAAPGWSTGFQGTNSELLLTSFSKVPDPSTLPQIAINGTLIAGGGSGSNTPTYISAPFDAIQNRARKDGTSLYWDLISTNPGVPGNSDACLVFVNAFAAEGFDRPGIHDDYSDSLINNVADSCNNTIVVIHNAGVRLVEQFVDHPNVTAIVFAHLPGQDSGVAIESLLYGDSQFSGRLPYSVPKNESDYGTILKPSQPLGDYILFPQDNYTEGVYIDYRAFDAKNITPRYEFGFGLSYTSFGYSNLTVAPIPGANLDVYPVGAILEGGHEDLWDVIYRVTATVANAGGHHGIEVAQLYIGIPGGPVKQLRGFEKVSVDVGKSITVSFDLLRRDLSEWDVTAQQWRLQRGNYQVWVGSSSRKLPLVGTLTI